jgi:hypothetical protein
MLSICRNEISKCENLAQFSLGMANPKAYRNINNKTDADDSTKHADKHQ